MPNCKWGSCLFTLFISKLYILNLRLRQPNLVSLQTYNSSSANSTVCERYKKQTQWWTKTHNFLRVRGAVQQSSWLMFGPGRWEHCSTRCGSREQMRTRSGMGTADEEGPLPDSTFRQDTLSRIASPATLSSRHRLHIRRVPQPTVPGSA